MSRNLSVTFGIILLVSCLCPAQTATSEQAVWKNPSLPLAQRVDDLVSRMTLEEKVSQMMDRAAGIPRLGVPAYDWWNEALHGVARAGNATVFPQAIGLGATWDFPLIHRIGDVISTEARAKYHEAIRQEKRERYYGLTFWSPNINIFRDPRWGRGQETYGEDPYLTARLGVAFVTGLQGDDPRFLKTVSTPKHYAVHSGPEPLRHQFDAKVAVRDMQDTYFPAFRATVEAGAWSVMCAYNSDNGQPACANDYLLKDMLRGRWGFKGYVVSDCGAVGDIFEGHKFVDTMEKASAVAVKTGTDLDCGDEYKSLVNAVKQGLISEAEIDVAVKRLMEARFRLGMFDPREMVPYAQISFSENDSLEHRQLALEAARKSIVLLKNDNFLPLSPKIKKIAVIGPNADSLNVLLGNYNGTPSAYVTPLMGIRKRFPEAKVTYAVGAPLNPDIGVLVPAAALHPSMHDKRHGLQAEYFGNTNLQGAPRLTRVDPQVNFDLDSGTQDVAPQGFRGENFSVRWTGVLVAPADGEYLLGATADDGVRLYLDGKLLFENWTQHASTTETATVKLERGRKYEIKMEFYQGPGGATARLIWQPPQAGPPTFIRDAVKLAKKSDVAIMVLGISPRLEGEEMNVKVDGFSGGDRTSIDLPAAQEELLKAVAATKKPMVVVLLNGSALAVNWAQEHAKAIVEAWYPGEEGGTAIAETLAGDNNPGGRLPLTFYKSVEQLPPFTEYAMAGRTYRYFTGDPLYPFGFGLSYSKFHYSDLKAEPREQGAVVTATVENTSSRDGDEVVQLYVTDLTSAGPKPVRSLAGFQRVHLRAGERQQVSFVLGPRELSLVNAEGKRVYQGGRFAISVGGRQPDAHPSTSDYVQGEVTLGAAAIELD